MIKKYMILLGFVAINFTYAGNTTSKKRETEKLINAILKKEIVTVEALLKNGVSPSEPGEYGTIPLQNAVMVLEEEAQSNYLEMCTLLLDYGASVHAELFSNTPLFCALIPISGSDTEKKRQSVIAKLLLEYGSKSYEQEAAPGLIAKITNNEMELAAIRGDEKQLLELLDNQPVEHDMLLSLLRLTIGQGHVDLATTLVVRYKNILTSIDFEQLVKRIRTLLRHRKDSLLYDRYKEIYAMLLLHAEIYESRYVSHFIWPLRALLSEPHPYPEDIVTLILARNNPDLLPEFIDHVVKCYISTHSKS